MIKVAHAQGRWVELGPGRVSAIREVVLTFTVKVVAALPLKFSLAGIVQTAPAGAPVQARLAVPVSPAPPIESV
jgi:hypothetical protein